MKSHTKVAVIGGGAMGVSLLYHLTKQGWRDVVLIEKNELTAGSTWHAAGLATHFAHNLTIQAMRAHSVKLYSKILTEETGDPVDFHQCGALRITRSQDRMDEFRHVKGLSRFSGYGFNILSPGELKEIYPHVELDGIIGAIHEPDDGHVDPTQATNAMAKGARMGGAEIYRHTCVTGLEQLPGGGWIVRTDKGDIQAEIIVNAAGTWCREIGEMMGLDLPVVPMLHQYLVTDSVPALKDFTCELPMIRDPEESWYVRQERDGFIIGPYEQTGHPWAVDGVPPEFGMELLPPELEWMEEILAKSMERIPILADAGVKTIVNGPITFTPDANLLLGPAYGLKNAWLLTGSSMGVMEGGGAGMMLAQWIANGEQPLDMVPLDPRRFGDYADRDYRLAKANEAYSRQFAIHYPGEELSAGRGLKKSALHDRLEKAGAVFGFAYGWERPNWFAAPGDKAETQDSYRRTNWHGAVAREVDAATNRAALADLSVFTKFEISGPDAARFMESLGSNRPPQKIGRISLIHVLSPEGGVLSEFTVTKLDDSRYYLTCAAAAKRHDTDILRVRSDGFDITIRDRTDQMGIIGLMGPKSREILSSLTGQSLENADFPWLSVRKIIVAGCECQALRVSYLGELGWELHMDMGTLPAVYDALWEVGRAHGISHYGAYAANSMRLEKAYRGWGSDLTVERTPIEAGLGPLVRHQDRIFVGRTRMLERKEDADHWSMHLLALGDEGPDPFYAHTVLSNGEPVGMVTSGAYGHRVGCKLALAYFRPGVALDNLTVEILGETVSAKILETVPFDPDNARMRG